MIGLSGWKEAKYIVVRFVTGSEMWVRRRVLRRCQRGFDSTDIFPHSEIVLRDQCLEADNTGRSGLQRDNAFQHFHPKWLLLV